MASTFPKLKLGRYNFLIAVEGGSENWLIYNALTDLGILVDTQTARSVSSALKRGCRTKPLWRYERSSEAESRLETIVDELDLKTVLALKKLAVLVNPGKEKIFVDDMIEGFLHPHCLKLSVAYSARCQMACRYCFQSGRDTSLRHDLSLVEKTLEWAEKHIHEHKLSALHVGLFGGEPLVDSDLGLAYAQGFKRLAERLSIPLEISLTTNGLNLNMDILRSLLECGLKYVRVTLDGPPEVHDLRRPTISGAGTFERILSNLKQATTMDGFGIGVAVNVDATTAKSIDALLDILTAAELENDVEIILEPLLPHISSRHSLSYRPEQVLASIADVFLRVVERKFATPLLPGLCGSCNVTQANSYVVDWNGDLFRCSFTMLEAPMSCGSIRSDLSEVNLRTAADADQKYAGAAEVLKGCLEKQCPYLPLCGGGCRFQAWLQKGDWAAQNCPERLFDKVAADAFAHSFGLKARRHSQCRAVI